jgi:ADP-heptose:LPS heptosyltransferase
MATVVAQALRSRFARVDALTLPGHRSTLERVPDIDDVLVDDGGDERALAARLRARAYDACVVTWATARTAHVAQFARIPERVGQARRLYSWRFTRDVTVRSERGDVLSPWSDILLEYARALGCDAPGAIPHFVPTAQDEADAFLVIPSAASVASEVEGPLPGKGGFIILHPTNAIATKRGIWPTQGWVALARALAERFGVQIVITGTDADAAIAQAIAGDHASIVSIAGNLGIGGFGALAKRARAFVGITTGSMHIAAAVGCPTIGIFPFQSDFPERWAPRGPRVAVVRPTYACHPGDTKENCTDYACIANLDTTRIVAATASLIESAAPS